MVWKNGWLAASLAVLAILTASPGEAASSEPVDFHNAAFIQTVGLTSIPYAALEFCHRIPSGCPTAEIVRPAVRLTEALWKQLLAVNAYYNTTIKPESDQQQYGAPDFWTYPDSGFGDCEDYQLAKQRALVAAGWPQSDL
jgi:predicted transglutaminase-like cysteine proteinase